MSSNTRSRDPPPADPATPAQTSVSQELTVAGLYAGANDDTCTITLNGREPAAAVAVPTLPVPTPTTTPTTTSAATISAHNMTRNQILRRRVGIVVLSSIPRPRLSRREGGQGRGQHC